MLTARLPELPHQFFARAGISEFAFPFTADGKLLCYVRQREKQEWDEHAF